MNKMPFRKAPLPNSDRMSQRINRIRKWECKDAPDRTELQLTKWVKQKRNSRLAKEESWVVFPGSRICE